MLVAKLLKVDVKMGNLKLVVEGSRRVVIEGFASELRNAFVGKAARIPYAVICEVKIFQPVDKAGRIKKFEASVYRPYVVLVGFPFAKELGHVLAPEDEMPGENLKHCPL